MFEQLVHESSLGWVLPKRPTNFATQLNLFPASHPIDQSSNLMPLLDLEEERRSTEQTRFKLEIGVGKFNWPDRNDFTNYMNWLSDRIGTGWTGENG